MSSASPSPEGGPTVLRILLGTQLRRLREANGVTREVAGEAIRASSAKISRLELGRVGCKERDVMDLLTLYGVTGEQERAEYRDLAIRANARGWWQQHSEVLPNWFEMYLRLEQAATVIRCLELRFVPGLLQTEHCAVPDRVVRAPYRHRSVRARRSDPHRARRRMDP